MKSTKADPVNQITAALNATRPLWLVAASLAALLTSWGFLAELVPVLKQVYASRIPYEKSAIVAGALALVGGAR
jgi:hypothetical protein